MDSVIRLLQDYLEQAVCDPEHAFLDVQGLPEEWRMLGQSLVQFVQSVTEMAALAKAMAAGNLSIALPPPTNEFAAPLKALHASLRHLTWQTQQVVKGDYQQRVDFMGEFSEAFNTMTAQLERRRAALLAEIETGRRRAKALEQSSSLFEAIFHKIPQWVVVVGGETFDWLYANRQPADALYDLSCEPQLQLWIRQQAKALAVSEKPSAAELALQGEAGIQYFSAEIHPICWYERRALAFMLTDISAEKARLSYLQNAAYVDMLTKLFNRHYAMNTLNEWLAERRSFILCFADIDNLKYVNDRYGHREGDQYILSVVGALSDFFSDMVLCRMGGDEFVILAQGLSADDTQNRMESLRSTLTNRDVSEDCRYDRSLSYGIIEVKADNFLPAQELLNIADEKMYEYKRAYKLRQKKPRGYKAEGETP